MPRLTSLLKAKRTGGGAKSVRDYSLLEIQLTVSALLTIALMTRLSAVNIG
jgi:hypothetical protein